MGDCPTCRDLWLEYANAISRQIDLETRLATAERKRESALLAKLTGEIQAAFRDRDEARQVIYLHQAMVHGKARAQAAN